MSLKQFNEDVILAGLDASYFDVTDDAWVDIPNITDVGAIGEQSEKKDKTNLSNTIKKYGTGMQDAPDKAIKGQIIPNQVDTSNYYDEYLRQQKFIKRCRNKEEMMFRVVWHDGSTNAFLFKALGFEFDSPSQDEWKMFTINGAQNTRTLWDVDFTGVASIAVAGTTTLTAVTDPTDLELDDDEVFAWASDDVSIATVDALTGEVTGVSAGTTYITAEIRGVTGYFELTVTA